MYSELIPYLAEHHEETRPAIVHDLIAMQIQLLILSDRLEHLRELQNSFPGEPREESVMIELEK